MSIEYIRKTYGLSCKVGQRVKYSPPGKPARYGKILGARGGYLRIKLDPLPGQKCHTGSFHPTWCLELLSELEERAEKTRQGAAG